MKRIIYIITIMTIFFLNITSAYALDISIDKVEILDKNSNISASNITSNELTIRPTISFNRVDDYIIYKISFKGKDINNYKVSEITDNNKSQNVTTTYKHKETLSSPVYLTMLYKSGASENTTMDDISMKINLTGEGSGESGESPASNPQTGLFSHIMVPLVLIVVSAILINHYTKYDENKNTPMIIILFILLIPLTVIAEIKTILTINIDASNIVIKESSATNTTPSTPTTTKYYVYLYPNGGTGISEGQKFEYEGTASFSTFPKVTKDNCTLSGWNVGSPDGKEYYQDVEPSDSGQKLYARWSCGGSGNIANLKIKITSGAKNELNQPIDSFLKARGSSLDAYNAYIKKSVQEAGMGTRAGVVAAAVSTINYLYDNYNTKMTYYWGGHFQQIGIPSRFGINSPSSASPSGKHYPYVSFDCSGFVNWAIKNGGYNFPDINSYDTRWTHCSITNSSCIGEPGDLIESAAHVVMIVKVEKENNRYLVAESTTSGVIVQPRGLHENMGGSTSTVVKMESYYSNAANKKSY